MPDKQPLPNGYPNLFAMYGALESDAPVALLPVRLETRFTPKGAGQTLKIRIYPDTIHVEQHSEKLLDTETADGRATWQALYQNTDGAARLAAWTALAEAHGPHRAAWIMRSLTPNGYSPDRLGSQITAIFTPKPTGDDTGPPLARMLPSRWFAVAFRDGSPFMTKWSAQIDDEIAVGLDPTDDAVPEELGDAGMAWMHDYDEALAKGMAITMNLADSLPIDELIVFGIDERWLAASGPERLDNLLADHFFGKGAGYLPVGTPTNNTDEANSPWDPRKPDLAWIAKAVTGADLLTGEIASAPRPNDDAALFAKALGLDAIAEPRAPVTGWENSDSTQSATSGAMNRAIWLATGGAFLKSMLDIEGGGNVSTSSQRVLAKEWVDDWVRPGGPLPTLRIGAQPYGILPVMAADAKPDDGDFSADLQNLINDLAGYWEQSLGNVPRLDPLATSAVGSEATESLFAEVMSMEPNPCRFDVTSVSSRRYTKGRDFYMEPGIVTHYEYCKQALQNLISTDYPFPSGSINLNFTFPNITTQHAYLSGREVALVDHMDGIKRDHDAIPGIIDGLRDQRADKVTEYDALLQGGVPSQILAPQVLAEVHELDAKIDVHEQRQDELSDEYEAREVQLDKLQALIRCVEAHIGRGELLQDLLGTGHVDQPLGLGGPQILFNLFSQTPRKWRGPLVRADDGPSLDQYFDWIDSLKSLGTVIDDGEADSPFSGTLPMLFQLLRQAMINALPYERLIIANKLQMLRGLGQDRLEQLLCESLGLLAHRLDAWRTSLATRRLMGIRDTSQFGLHYGAYGWVTDLKPDTVVDDSLGFIHMPSISQANTAAVLRSAWLAHGTTNADSPAAVDLSSDRVRIARRMLEGVRQGQDMGDLLGARFERAMHDAGLDAFIDDYRDVVRQHLEAIDPDAPACQSVVDGLALHELRDTAEVKVVASQGRQVEQQAMDAALDDLATTIDAIADLGLAESVHQLVQGNPIKASAMADAISTGETPPPEPQFIRTPRAAKTLTHKVLAIWPADPDTRRAWPGASTSSWAQLSPGLEAWVAALLGDAKSWTMTLVYPTTRGRDITQRVDLSRSDLAALDIVRAASGEAELKATLSAAGDRIMLNANPERQELLEVTPTVDLSALEALMPIARELHTLLGQVRPLTEADLTGASDGVETKADDVIMDRLEDDFADAVGALETAIDKQSGIQDAVAALMPYGVRSTPQRVDVTAAKSLLAGAKARADKVKSGSNEERIQALAGGKLVIPQAVRVADDAAINDNLNNGPERLESPGDIALWQRRVARVRERVRTMMDIQDLSPTGGPVRPLFEHKILQWPDVPGEAWIGTQAPDTEDPTRATVVLMSVSGQAWDTKMTDPGVAGIVIDAWSERLPEADVTTGLTFHFDSPGARAPQAILIATPGHGDGWSFAQMRDVLHQTLSASRQRAVDPERLVGLGQLLPAVFAADGLNTQA